MGKGGGFGSLALGSSTTGSAAFNIRMDKANVANLISNAGVGFNDTWFGGKLTQSPESYTPSTALGTIGMPNNFGVTNGQPLIFKFSSSWPVGLVTNANSVFTMSDGVNIGAAGVGFTIGQESPCWLRTEFCYGQRCWRTPLRIYGGALASSLQVNRSDEWPVLSLGESILICN